jgi:lysozyme
MKVSASFFKLLEEFEGYRECPYLDSANVPTIGIGTTRYPDGTRVTMRDECIKHDKAVFYATNAVAGVEYAVSQVLPELNQNQFDALVSFVYNIGTGAFANSTMLTKAKKDVNDPSIKTEFSKWTKVRNPKTGLLEVNNWQVKRRLKESNLYFTKLLSNE